MIRASPCRARIVSTATRVPCEQPAGKRVARPSKAARNGATGCMTHGYHGDSALVKDRTLPHSCDRIRQERRTMARMRIEGSFVALITPFNADGSVDYGAFRTLLDWQAANGTSAVLIMGSTGEVSMLTPDERREIVER